MAGSRLDVIYTTDAGQNFFINVDKSNVTQANGAPGVPTATDNGLPRNIRPRVAVYRSDDRLHTIVVPMLTVTKLNEAPATIKNYSGVDCKLLYRRPERRRVGSAFDTGITNP